MCQQVQRILIRRSRKASQLHGGVYIVTVCRHDVCTRWRLDSSNMAFSKFGENAWQVTPLSAWPSAVKDFMANGLEPPRRAASAKSTPQPGMCVCGQPIDGVFMCRTCEAKADRQLTRRASKKTRRQKNAAKAKERLEQWQRRLKIAQRKVKEYARKVRYYDRNKP